MRQLTDRPFRSLWTLSFSIVLVCLFFSPSLFLEGTTVFLGSVIDFCPLTLYHAILLNSYYCNNLWDLRFSVWIISFVHSDIFFLFSPVRPFFFPPSWAGRSLSDAEWHGAYILCDFMEEQDYTFLKCAWDFAVKTSGPRASLVECLLTSSSLLCHTDRPGALFLLGSVLLICVFWDLHLLHLNVRIYWNVDSSHRLSMGHRCGVAEGLAGFCPPCSAPARP